MARIPLITCTAGACDMLEYDVAMVGGILALPQLTASAAALTFYAELVFMAFNVVVVVVVVASGCGGALVGAAGTRDREADAAELADLFEVAHFWEVGGFLHGGIELDVEIK